MLIVPPWHETRRRGPALRRSSVTRSESDAGTADLSQPGRHWNNSPNVFIQTRRAALGRASDTFCSTQAWKPTQRVFFFFFFDWDTLSCSYEARWHFSRVLLCVVPTTRKPVGLDSQQGVSVRAQDSVWGVRVEGPTTVATFTSHTKVIQILLFSSHAMFLQSEQCKFKFYFKSGLSLFGYMFHLFPSDSNPTSASQQYKGLQTQLCVLWKSERSSDSFLCL